jgi:hypothetical protein
MADDGTLLNNDAFMVKVISELPELKDIPKDHKLYIGDMVKIDGRVHMWYGQKWVIEDTVYMVQAK